MSIADSEIPYSHLGNRGHLLVWFVYISNVYL